MIILTILSIGTLVGIADGVDRFVQARNERVRREDLFRRGFIL